MNNLPNATEAASEKLCVIKNPRLGYDPDARCLMLSFDAYETESMAAEVRLSGQALNDAFADTKAPNVEWFKGKTCWCTCGQSCIIYIRMFKYV